MIISFIVVYFGEKDASTFSDQYNSMNSKDTINLLILKKYTEKVSIPPIFTFKCTNLKTNDTISIKVSRGEYDITQNGDTIFAFKTTSDQYITNYEIDNQWIIKIGNKGYSFVLIPVFMFLIVGFTCLYFLIRKFIIK